MSQLPELLRFFFFFCWDTFKRTFCIRVGSAWLTPAQLPAGMMPHAVQKWRSPKVRCCSNFSFFLDDHFGCFMDDMSFEGTTLECFSLEDDHWCFHGVKGTSMTAWFEDHPRLHPVENWHWPKRAPNRRCQPKARWKKRCCWYWGWLVEGKISGVSQCKAWSYMILQGVWMMFLDVLSLVKGAKSCEDDAAWKMNRPGLE